MKRTLWMAFVAMGLAQLGCGGKSETGTADAGGTAGSLAAQIQEGSGPPPAPFASPATASAPATANPALDAMVPLNSLNLANPTKPEEVVGAFLDGMRTGNAVVIEGLLSTRARKEIADKGLDIAPIGSPQARFEIGVAQQADPSDPNTMLVSSNWLEPAANGQAASEYEVVWALIREAAGWRICEMAVDTHLEGEEIQVVNFENLSDVVPAGNAPATTSSPEAVPASSAPRTAANPNVPANPPAAPSGNALPSLPPSNLPPVNPPPRGSLPELPTASGSGTGSLPPLPPSGFGPSGFGGAVPGQPGRR
jgi:hypothetical protein